MFDVLEYVKISKTFKTPPYTLKRRLTPPDVNTQLISITYIKGIGGVLDRKNDINVDKTTNPFLSDAFYRIQLSFLVGML